MNFHEVRFPARLAFGSSGGVERRTEVVTLASGFERRSTPWARSRRRWLVGAGVRSLDDMAELVAFFEARMGRLYGFRFRDFADCKSCAPSGTPGAEDQGLGTGDGTRTVFPLLKSYGEVLRPVVKPVAGTVRVAVAGVELEAGEVEVDPATGLVTLGSAPAAGQAVTAGYQFDAAVRFDSDRMDVTLEGFDAGRAVAVPLVEVRI